MLHCSMKALVECNRALTSTDFRPELAKIDVPTLIVHGDRDVLRRWRSPDARRRRYCRMRQ